MKREVSPRVKKIISGAMSEAKNFNDSHIKPSHIVLSLISDGDNACYEVFHRRKVDIMLLFDVICENLNHEINPAVTTRKVRLPFSDETKKIFDNVDKESEKMGESIVDTAHIMLSLLSNTKLNITQILSKYGITYKIFKKELKDMANEINENIHYLNYEEINEADDDFIFDDNDKEPPIKKNRKNKGSKTPVLDNFCRDITKAANENKVDPVIGREKEIKRVSQILSRRKKNNPILIGEPGVGKSSVVEGLATMIKDGKAPRVLLNKKIYSLDLASIVAGTKYRGQFEERMKAILDELILNDDIVLFIDEIHTIVGAGNAAGSLDASNIFKPALARGEIQVIGATTLDEFRENIEKDGALTRRFQQVLIEEPTLDETKVILENIKGSYETHHKVIYTDDAIEECVKLSDRYITDRAMPDKAIDILDEAGATTNINQEAPENIKKLEERKGSIQKKKLDVVKKQKYEEAAKLRDEEKKLDLDLDIAKNEWVESLDKKRTVVDVGLVSEIVSMMTGIPLNKISAQENKKLMTMDKDLTGKVIGQDDAVSKVVKAIKRNRLGIKDKSKPIASFIFLGPTGVGKSLLAKKIAENMFGDADSLIRMDMSEYMEKFSVSRLIGPPPGYVGYEEGGQLTEKVRRKPYSVILFDEIEKANDDVFNILLQLLDEGQLTDGLGRKVNFKNCLIILTSNIGVKELNSFGKSMGFKTDATIANEEERARSIIEKALKKKFKPEFLNRIDDTIIFNSLSQEDIHKIIHIELDKLKERILELGYKMTIGKNAIEYVAKQGYDEAYGARPLNRAIQRYIEDPVADAILSGNFEEGGTIKVSYDKKQDKIVLA